MLFILSQGNLVSQDLLGVKIGGFFEQVYGGETNEEGIDLCSTQDEYLMSGWTEVPYEEIYNKDATFWYIDRIGGQKYSKSIGSQTRDEVATGIVSVSPEYFAICVHESSNWMQDEVQVLDRLWVHYIEVATGNIVWSDVVGSVEGGIAPSDIQYDGKGGIYVLANHLNPSGGVMTEILKYNLSGVKLWTSQPYYNSGLGYWSSELIVGQNNTLVTMPYNYDLESAEAVIYSTSGTLIGSNQYQENFPSRVYGILQDPITSEITGVGYILGENNDTNAYLINISNNLVKNTSVQYGISGVEKFRDIVSTTDGFICAGTRNNKGEGGYDCYINHMDISFSTFFEETFGGTTNERLSSLLINNSSTKAWFAGYNAEYTVSNSGNAYVGGVTTQLAANNQSQCELPRIMLIDRLVEPGKVNDWWRLANWSVVGQRCEDFGVNIVFLYDVDLIFKPGSGASQATKDEVFKMIRDLKWRGIRVGIVAGPEISKLKAINDIMTGITTTSIQLPGKVNYIMLEHEFWNWQKSSEIVVLDPNDYGASWTSQNPYTNYQNSNNILDLANADEYYWHLTKDHKTLLEEIDAHLPQNKNWWGAMDYISFLNRIDNPYSPSQVTLYQNFENGKVLYDIKSPNINNLTVINTPQLYRENLAEEFISLVDFTFLVSYRVATQSTHFINTNNTITSVPNYAFSLASENWHLRHEAYAAKSNFAKDTVSQKFNFIPLFSNEQLSCVIFGLKEEHLGKWLGANNGYNTYHRNEQAYYDQWFNAPSHCLDCNTETQLAAFGWYKYGCIASHGLFSDPNGLNPHRRILCGSANVNPLDYPDYILSQIEEVDVYPNPANTHVYVRIDEEKLYDYDIVGISGQKYKSGQLTEKENYIDLTDLPFGVYIFQVKTNSSVRAFKVIIGNEK